MNNEPFSEFSSSASGLSSVTGFECYPTIYPSEQNYLLSSPAPVMFPCDEHQTNSNIPCDTTSAAELFGESVETQLKGELPIVMAETSKDCSATTEHEANFPHAADDAHRHQDTRTAWSRRSNGSRQRNYVLSFVKEADLKDVVCCRSKPHVNQQSKKKARSARTKRQEYIATLEKSLMQHTRELDTLRERLAVAQQENVVLKSQLLLFNRQQCASPSGTFSTFNGSYCQ